MRKRRNWAQDASIWATIIVGLAAGFPAAIYVHVNLPQWEAPAVFISLGLSALPALWYWRVGRYGWVVAIISSALIAFGALTAILHGWALEAKALYGAASVLVFVVILVAFARIGRLMESAARAVGEEINGDPLFRREVLFRDDGQRIVVYPRRHRLVTSAVALAAILAGIGVAFVLWRSADTLNDNVPWILVGLFACLMLYFFLSVLYRLLVQKPSLVVGPDGIFDNGTLSWSGVGLLRWDEILSVTPTTRSSGSVTHHYLDILVTDLPAIRRRLPFLKRLALRITNTGMSQVLIEQSMLETPVGELAEQVNQYVKAHAPPGWFGDEAQDDAATLDGGDKV